MHIPSSASLTSQPDALRRLLDAILAGDDVTLFIRSDDGRALLDEAADCLAKRRCRVLRVADASSDGLGLPVLMAQVTGQPYSSDRNDEFLKRGIQALTALDGTCDRIVLLVSDANTLQSAALRYIQLACRAGTNLQLVLAGKRGFLDLLNAHEFTHLRKRLAAGPIITPLAPKPTAFPAVDAAFAVPVAASIAPKVAAPAPGHTEPMQPGRPPVSAVQALERHRLRLAFPKQSSFSSRSYRRRRLAALTGIGVALAGCAAVVVWRSEVAGPAARGNQVVAVVEEPAPRLAVVPAPTPPTATEAALAPEAPLSSQPPAATEEANVPVAAPSAAQQPAPPGPVAQQPSASALAAPQLVQPDLAAPQSPPSAPLPKSAVRRNAPAPRSAAVRSPTFSAGSVTAWEDPYPPASREWRPVAPPQAMSDLPEQSRSYIGTYTTDANGVRSFRFSR